MRIRLFLSFLFVCVIAYFNMAQTTDDNTKKYFSGMNFPNFEEPNTGLARAVNFQDTLEITVEFSECGQWGGRKEKIMFYRDERKNIKAKFTMDTVCCNSIVVKNGVGVLDDNTREIKIDFTKTLIQDDERLINLFIHRVLELYLNHELFKWNENLTFENDEFIEEEDIIIFGDSGVHIEIKSTSSNLFLSFYNFDRVANTWYGKVRKQLFGESLNGN